MADAAVSSSVGVADTDPYSCHVPMSLPAWGRGDEIGVAAFNVAFRGYGALGFHPDQHRPTGQELSLAGLHLPLLKAV